MTVAAQDVALPPPLWDGATRRFDGARLLLAIATRGWDIETFADDCRPRLHANTIRKAVAGHPVRTQTALRIYNALDRRQPTGVR